MRKRSVAKRTPAQGCGCPAFAQALQDKFIESRDGRIYLADHESGPASGGPGWHRLYGPEITHCPFCGALLVPLGGAD